MIFNWFESRAVRHARDMCKHVRKLLDAQRDILSPQAIGGMESALNGLQAGIRDKTGEEALKKQMLTLDDAAGKWLKPYPNASTRENVEVLLVALSVAMAIRTFFLQPFKIPTGSMQPTLFGVTPGLFSGNQPDLKVPGPLQRFWEFWTHGYSYHVILAPEDGQLQAMRPATKFLMFDVKQEYEFNNKWYSVWSPGEDLFQRAGYQTDYSGNVLGIRHADGTWSETPQLKAGQPIVQLKTIAGDHLFVDRLTYNFRHPTRGEIIVFETRNIPTLPGDQFYIKRLVALPNEHVQLGKDRHLVIDGKRLDQNTPHFDKVYSFDPSVPASESHYSGHVDDLRLAPLFADNPDGFTVRPGHFMVMGDNTVNSLDSRTWGDFSRTNVIGKYFFVYWPFSPRFGCSVH
jgi:signal peptidase I